MSTQHAPPTVRIAYRPGGRTESNPPKLEKQHSLDNFDTSFHVLYPEIAKIRNICVQRKSNSSSTWDFVSRFISDLILNNSLGSNNVESIIMW